MHAGKRALANLRFVIEAALRHGHQYQICFGWSERDPGVPMAIAMVIVDLKSALFPQNSGGFDGSRCGSE